jgi:hypothetical protein
MYVPPETVQFLAQLRHAAIFAQQIKPLSSKLKLLKEQLPKKLTSVRFFFDFFWFWPFVLTRLYFY